MEKYLQECLDNVKYFEKLAQNTEGNPAKKHLNYYAKAEALYWKNCAIDIQS